jgi:hypothetical protein
MDKPKLIDDAVRKLLVRSGVLPEVLDLAVQAVKRDGIAYDESSRIVTGVREAVAAFRKEKPGLFSSGYRDLTKPLEQIERERDQQIFGTSAGGYH